MKAPRTVWLSSAAILIAIGSAITVKSFQGNGAPGNSAAVTAPWVRGVLSTAIPYRAPRAGAGLLTVEILNPEDEVLARSERHVDVSAAAGVWRDELKPAKPLAADDLVWHRLSYRFRYDPEKTPSIHGI